MPSKYDVVAASEGRLPWTDEDRARTGLYVDELGRAISTHSMLKTFRRCPMQAYFKLELRLKPRIQGVHLKRGTWVHSLLEEFHGPGGVEAMWAKHAELSRQFDGLFDEEKDEYGDMPREIKQIMQSYAWHYEADTWVVHEREFTLETLLPDGRIYRGKVDALIEDQFGLWLVDHKTHKTLPRHDYRVLDTQSPLYIKAAWDNDIPVLGFIWNYVRWKAPSKPQMAYKGTKRQRLSTKDIDTDYLTFARALKEYRDEYGLDIAPYRAQLRQLKSQRYDPHSNLQQSSFFRRDRMEKAEDMIGRAWTAAGRTSNTMNTYDFSDMDAIERVVDRSCEFSCSYTGPCGAHLIGANWQALVRQNYTTGDPMDYYQDGAGDLPHKED